MSPTQEKIYEMLWDCEYCDTKKLLGKSQRHCPVCGAAQNPEKRYFPAEDEKVAVDDHPYVGADILCPACKAANSKAAAYCTECGSPLEGAASVKLIGDTGTPDAPKPETPAVSPKAPPKPKNKKKLFIGLSVVFLVIVSIFVMALWEEDIALTATAHTWQREIRIENFMPRKKDAWCDQLPGDAYSVSRSREVRSHRKVADGKECHTERRDRGDGTYSEKEVCKTKYRSEPVYSDKCYFTVNRWDYARSITAIGRSVKETPHWPLVTLSKTGTGIGAEREGPRHATYKVQFKTAKGGEETCDFPEEKWRGLADGAVFNAKIGVITGILDCSTVGSRTTQSQ